MSNLSQELLSELKSFLNTDKPVSPSSIKSTMNTSPSTSSGIPAPPTPHGTVTSLYPVSTAVRLPSPQKKLIYHTFPVPTSTTYVRPDVNNWRNINDNINQIRFAFTKGSYSDHIIGFNLNLGPVQGERTDQNLFPYLYLASVGEANLLARPQKDTVAMIISILNLTAPNIAEKALTLEEARLRFIGQVKALITAENLSNKYFVIQEATWDALVTDDNNLPKYATLITDIADSNITAETANIVMTYLLTVSTDMVKNIGRMIYIQTFVSFAKRGSITEEKCGRLNEQITQELGFDPKLKPELTLIIYDNLKHLINETNAGAIFGTWADNMAEFSLRAQILLSQTVGSGLTSLYVIKEAFSLAPNFNWAQAAQILPADFQNVKQAFATVGNNPYYGFANDLGPVKSTKYKSLAYLAKELCRKIGGPAFASLSSYGGWTTNPLHKLILNQMVKAYNPIEVDEDGILVGITQDDIDESSTIVSELVANIKVSFL